MNPEPPPDLARTTLQLLTLGALIITAFWIVRPFLVATAWATMIAVATWPLLLHVQAGFWGRRAPAVVVMTGALLVVLVVPFYLGISAVVEHADEIADWSTALANLTIPEPPEWVGGIPVIGSKLALRWQQVAAATPEDVAERLAPFAHTIAPWFVGQVGG